MSVSAVATRKNSRQASHKRNQAIVRIVATIMLSLGSLLVLFPLVWMLSTALKSDAEVMINPSLIPRDWRFDNFAKAWNSAPFMMYLKNTILITIIGMIGTVCSCSLVAYGFAKIRFKGRDVIFLCVLGTMMIPGMVTMVPPYVMYSKLGWVGTFLPLTVSNFFGSAYYVFLLRQSFLGIPMTYNEAAKLEGASELQIFSRIIMPLSKPILTTILVFEFNAKWNDYFGPMLYLNKQSQFTLQIGLRTFRGTAGVEWQKFMAASLIVLLPTVIVYAVLQKYILQGVASGGIKG